MKLNNFLNSIKGAGRDLVNREYQKRKVNPPSSMGELCAALYSNKGEALGTALATEVVTAYGRLDADERLDFFRLLLNEYSPDPQQIQECATACQSGFDAESLRNLIEAVEPPRQHLLRRMNMAHQGTGEIVKMRRDLLKLMREHPELEMVDDDFQHLLGSWFNPGFLVLKEIDWNSSASILEKLIAYEAVHEMTGWSDLRRRLEDDRRCFGYFHPALPEEPIIFVEVALVRGLASSIQPILAPSDEDIEGTEVDTAIFYSISNCQAGLRGISFGNFLIKKVVLELQRKLPELKQFATLSPIPGFNKWLMQQLDSAPDSTISGAERQQLAAIQNGGWQPSADTDSALQNLLMRLCAQYLYREKRGDLPLDAVARFHLGNGASIERLNWFGDSATHGIAQSLGILVNYRYDLNSVEANHEKFFNSGEIEASKNITSLL